MLWLWILLGVVALLAGLAFAFHLYLFTKYIPFAVRGVTERPLFIIPFGQPVDDAEDIPFPTTHGLTLHGCYLKANGPRQGVILFGLEFGSNRWSCRPYCDFLRDAGYDIFAFEMRGQGQSPKHAGYEPLQWVTGFEVDDFRAAVTYLKSRPDADPRGIGFYGISKGGSAGLVVAAEDPYILCCVTDGIFATQSTVTPYLQKFIHIYTHRAWVAYILPRWYYAYAARHTMKLVSAERHCTFPPLEKSLPLLNGRPLLMIHGGADNYIKPEMAQQLFALAGTTRKDLWLVDGAKHNQALHLAGEEYRRRVLDFFQAHLAGGKESAARNGVPGHGVTDTQAEASPSGAAPSGAAAIPAASARPAGVALPS